MWEEKIIGKTWDMYKDNKYLYDICDKLLNREQKSVLPTHDCATSLANTFVDYFKN